MEARSIRRSMTPERRAPVRPLTLQQDRAEQKGTGGNRGNRDFPKAGCGLELAWLLHLSVRGCVTVDPFHALVRFASRPTR